MHAVRLFRPIRAANRQFSRSISAAAATTTTARSNDTVIPLSNVEAQWEKLTPDEQLTVHQQIEELQKRDWKTLSLDEKKAGTYIRFFLELFPPLGTIVTDHKSVYAAYYIAFGPHGPRADLHPPGTVPKLILAILVGVSAGGALYLTSRALGRFRENATCFPSNCADRAVSQPASKYHDQGMARSFERACSRVESRSHHR